MSLRMFATLAAVALLAAAPLMVAAACTQQKGAGAADQKAATTSADPITGEWDVTFEIADSTAVGTLDLKLDGDKVTGTADSHHTGPGKIRDGSWADGKLKFTLDFASHESIALTGAPKDGGLAGEFATEGMTGKWTAKRKG